MFRAMVHQMDLFTRCHQRSADCRRVVPRFDDRQPALFNFCCCLSLLQWIIAQRSSALDTAAAGTAFRFPSVPAAPLFHPSVRRHRHRRFRFCSARLVRNRDRSRAISILQCSLPSIRVSRSNSPVASFRRPCGPIVPPALAGLQYPVRSDPTSGRGPFPLRTSFP